MDLGKERLWPYLTTIIAPLYRELDSTYADQGMIPQFTTYGQNILVLLFDLYLLSSDPTLKNLAQELIELLKKLVGLERFSLAFAAVQREATERRASRKKQKAMQVRVAEFVKHCSNHILPFIY